MAEETRLNNLTMLTAEIVANYVSHNAVQADKIGDVIASIHQALSSVGQSAPIEPQTPEPDKAAIRKSMTPDHLVSFVDGRKYKSLKRHLTTNGMTPAEYRERYGLDRDYPMVAPSYSAQRSELAKTLGLGRKPGPAPAPTAKGRAKGKSVKSPEGSIA